MINHLHDSLSDQIITVETKPLQLTDGSALQFNITQVAIGTKTSIEFHIGSMTVLDPNVDCWFAISLEYDRYLRDGSIDRDIIITDGELFFLARRRLGDSKLKLTTDVRDRLIKAITEFTRKL